MFNYFEHLRSRLDRVNPDPVLDADIIETDDWNDLPYWDRDRQTLSTIQWATKPMRDE